MSDKCWGCEQAAARDREQAQRIAALEKALGWAVASGLARGAWTHTAGVENGQALIYICDYCGGHAKWKDEIQHTPDCPAGQALALRKEADHA